MNTDVTAIPTRYWSRLADGRVQCEVCPRRCRLHAGQRGLCFVRGRDRDGIELHTYGRSSGFCVDPIEKKPLNHFLPGSAVLSFGTAGCNLACRFCQNWDLSRSRAMDTLADSASPAELGPDVPLHFSAFHPDWKVMDRPPTPPATLTRARDIALRNGLHYVYTGNVHDRRGGSTWCPGCGALLIERDGYELGQWGLTHEGACAACGLLVPGVFASQPGTWGARRQPVYMHR